MSLISVSSPHAHQPGNTGHFMQQVILATIPGLAALTYFFGWGTFINVIWCSLVALASEALVLYLRKKPIKFYLSDYSALVTAVLLALAIPPYAPWWLSLIGTSFAIIIAKQLYGGMGMNPFNPAMIGYVLLLISFPLEMTSWLPPQDVLSSRQGEFGFLTALSAIFTGSINGETIDAFTMATPLDSLKTAARDNLMFSDAVAKYEVFGSFAGFSIGKGWFVINVAFLLGGLYLIYKKIITWHIPVGVLGALFLMSCIFWFVQDSYGSPFFHLFSGGAMLGAFFIATDPVSAASSNKGRFIYGVGIGILIYVIRVFGGYPDAIAFSVLLLNLAAPTIDYYTQPRTYGHEKANRGANQ